jgi:hypothetical protein
LMRNWLICLFVCKMQRNIWLRHKKLMCKCKWKSTRIPQSATASYSISKSLKKLVAKRNVKDHRHFGSWGKKS